MKFEYNKELGKLKTTFDIALDAKDHSDNYADAQNYIDKLEELLSAVDVFLQSKAKKEVRINKLKQYGISRKEAKKNKNGFCLTIDGNVFRDSPDLDGEVLVIENSAANIKKFWIEDLPINIQNKAPSWEIVNLSNGEVVEAGLINKSK